MMGQLAIAPILVPMVTAALLLLVGARRRRVSACLSFASCAVLVIAAAALMVAVSQDGVGGSTIVYRIGNWPANVAIVLVVDRLSALMLLLTAVLALVVMPYALGRWQHMGVYFQPLVQLLLMGLGGAFLTGDLFSLFVFFEVLLAASYGLALHGSGPRRVGASLHYIVVNLVASTLFLLGVSLIFSATGTLNMAVLARLVPDVTGGTLLLLHAGAALLGVAFMIKAAIWPLGFWLPRAYSAAAPPVAALFAIMTELGIYVLLRLSLLLFGDAAGPASAHFGGTWMLWAGIATVVAGSIGTLGARELGKLAAYSAMVSAGSLLGAISLQQPAIIAGALAYMVISVLGIAAFFLLGGLVMPRELPEDRELLEPYDATGEVLYSHEDETRVDNPASIVVLSACFMVSALLLAGLPPLSGFLAKFTLLAPMLERGTGAIVLFAMIVAGSLCTVIAMCRAGIQIFWADAEPVFPRVRASETASVITLLALGLLLTFVVAAPWRYLSVTSQQIHAPRHYIDAVLGQPAGGRQ